MQATYQGQADSLVVEVVPLTVIEPGSNLPVRFTSISAQYTGKKVLVNWVTAQELNNKYFVVERSIDGRIFVAVGQVSATNAPQGSRYQWIDEKYITGKNYYRIRQVDLDGKSSISPVVMVMISAKGNIRIYPNPADSKLVIEAGNLLPGKHSVRILNGVGQAIFTQTFTSGNNIITVPLEKWSSGIYWVEVTDEQQQRILTSTFIKR